MSCDHSDPLALQVLGDSMTPEFEEGHVIVIEPDGVVNNGSYVLAKHEGEFIFRQLEIEDERYFLKPLNNHYPVLEISGMEDIHGVITQQTGRRRKDRKHYI